MNISFDASPVTLIFLIVTVAVSLLAPRGSETWRWLALEPQRMIRKKEFHGLATSGLVHSGGLHLFINMFVLYMFGPPLEQVLGPKMFLVLYLVSLLVGSLYPFLKYRDHPAYIAVGASGAISGVVFAFAILFPMHTIYLFFVLPMPAFVFAILYVLYSVYAMKRIDDNIGHEAHLGGAVGGVLVTLILRPDILSDLLVRLG